MGPVWPTSEVRAGRWRRGIRQFDPAVAETARRGDDRLGNRGLFAAAAGRSIQKRGPQLRPGDSRDSYSRSRRPRGVERSNRLTQPLGVHADGDAAGVAQRDWFAGQSDRDVLTVTVNLG